MSDTPIAERLAADLGMPWPLDSQRMHGSLFDFFEPAGSETGDGGSPEGCGPEPRQGPHPPDTEGGIDG